MKYNNTRPVVDGIKFDSKREAERYKELKLLERAGKISDLILQPRFELLPKYTINGTYRDWETDRKSTRLNSSHSAKSRMPSSA